MMILVCISISIIFAYGSCHDQLQSGSMTTSSICTTTSGPASSDKTTFTSLISASSNQGTSPTTVMEETTTRAAMATSTLIISITPTPCDNNEIMATTPALSGSKTTEITTIISMSLAPTTLANTSADDDDLDLPLLPVWISQLSALTVMGTILLLAMCGCATWCCVRVVCQRNVRYRIRRRQDKSLLQYALWIA